jgi:hypothetical protein
VTITTAKRDHTHLGTQSRHYSYQAVDIAIIDDKGIGDARSNSTMRDKGERLAKALESLGYRRNTESGNSKSVLWYFYTPRAGNHFNHLHISRLWSAK